MQESIIRCEKEFVWPSVQHAVHNAVVHVVAHGADFDWCEPYQAHEDMQVHGTGFFIDKEGHLVTSAHVVDQARTVFIRLPGLGARTVDAHVVSICPDRDIALLRIDAVGRDIFRQELGGIVPLTLGDSDTVQATDSVVMLGYPLGQHGTRSSMSIVSGRELGNGRPLFSVAGAVNPGSSGGPVFNVRGDVVGLVRGAVFFERNETSVIPINELHIIMDDLYAHPFVRTPLLGAQFNCASPEHAQLFGNPLPAGLYIAKIIKGSLFERAGVCAGDMLYEFNGVNLDMYGQSDVSWCNDKVSIHDLVARLKIGDVVSCVVYRAGNRRELSFVFEPADPRSIRQMYPAYESVCYQVLAGMVVMQLADNHLPILAPYCPSLVSYGDIERKMIPRLVISHIIPGSVVQQARCLEIGDIITHVNGIAVETLDDFTRALDAYAMRPLITIKTESEVLAVLSLKKIMEDEVRLSHAFSYPLSPLMKMLLNDQL